MTIDAITVTAATAVYGLATTLLWVENLLGRRVRNRQLRNNADSDKQCDLHSAF